MAFERLFDWLFAPIARLAAALSDPERRERTAILTLIGYVAIWTLYAVLAKGSQDIHRDMPSAMPNPSAMGKSVCARIRRTIVSAPEATCSRAPVTPSREIP